LSIQKKGPTMKTIITSLLQRFRRIALEVVIIPLAQLVQDPGMPLCFDDGYA
jgi:hypothetical protein